MTAVAKPATTDLPVKLSIIVPAFNEARTIAALLEAVRAVDLGGLGLEREILVVSDGSTDETAAVARAQPGVEVQRYKSPTAARAPPSATASSTPAGISSSSRTPISSMTRRTT